MLIDLVRRGSDIGFRFETLYLFFWVFPVHAIPCGLARMPDFGDHRPFWPDGGLLGPRHPAWGQATSGLEDGGCPKEIRNTAPAVSFRCLRWPRAVWMLKMDPKTASSRSCLAVEVA